MIIVFLSMQKCKHDNDNRRWKPVRIKICGSDFNSKLCQFQISVDLWPTLPAYAYGGRSKNYSPEGAVASLTCNAEVQSDGKASQSEQGKGSNGCRAASPVAEASSRTVIVTRVVVVTSGVHNSLISVIWSALHTQQEPSIFIQSILGANQILTIGPCRTTALMQYLLCMSCSI